MDRPDELHRRIAELEERLSRLSGASLRINESLDFGAVLQEVVDSARTLTASRYGVIGADGPEFTGNDEETLVCSEAFRRLCVEPPSRPKASNPSE